MNKLARIIYYTVWLMYERKQKRVTQMKYFGKYKNGRSEGETDKTVKVTQCGNIGWKIREGAGEDGID